MGGGGARATARTGVHGLHGADGGHGRSSCWPWDLLCHDSCFLFLSFKATVSNGAVGSAFPPGFFPLSAFG